MDSDQITSSSQDQDRDFNPNPLPKALFVADSCSEHYLVKRILDVEEFPDKLSSNCGYPWKISTKYYNAIIDLCPYKSTDSISDDILTFCEAFVLRFDHKHPESFQNIKNWVSNKKEYLPDVLLLVSDSLDNEESKVKEMDVKLWCVENKFEFIELDAKESESIDDYAIITEKFGIDRIIEALTVHTWSNMEMVNSEKSNKPKKENKACPESLEFDENDDFCELFSRLHSMKESLQSLPWRDRQQGAENLVRAFLSATGGLEDEEFDSDLG